MKLFIALIIPQLAGIIGSYFTTSAITTWYTTLERPTITPPNWVFGPTWILLYVLMGIALFLVWRKGLQAPGVRIALILFGLQLILNTVWSVIFFGLHNPGAALMEIALLWCAIIATMIAFVRVSKPAVWLLVPYIAWVSFAAYLNYSFWVLNM